MGSFAAELKKLPAPVRAALKAACGGDWDRVTLDGRGGYTVHNNPVRKGTKAVAKKAPAKAATKTAAKAAAPKAPAKKAPARAAAKAAKSKPDSKPQPVKKAPPTKKAKTELPAPRPRKAASETCAPAKRPARKRIKPVEIVEPELVIDLDAPAPELATAPEPTPSPAPPAPTPAIVAKTTVLPPAMPRGKYKCSLCQGTGHNARACKQAPQGLSEKPSKLRTRVDIDKLAEAIGTRRPQMEPGVNIIGTSQLEREERIIKAEEEFRAAQIYVAPDPNALPSFDWQTVDLGETSQRMCNAWREGLPASIGYYYLPDVLALYGLDQELVEAALRSPNRVEVRPESFNKDKRYAVLGFYRGDVMVVLGLREPNRPCIIAAYASSRLEGDHHRVGHTGGGGKKEFSGLPKTPKQLVVKLRGMGAEVAADYRKDTAPVTFHGQELGSISCGDIVTRRQVEQDFQRMQRKIHAINRREGSVAS